MESIYKKKFSVNEEQTSYSNELFESTIKSYRLTEKTFNINKDVDFIYNKFFKKFIDDFQKNNIKPPIKLYGKINSSELSSKDSKTAHKIYPIIIYCGVFNKGSFNNFRKNEESIFISLNKDAIENIDYKDMMNDNVKRSIENGITEHRVKATIYHELSHWISDAKYNSYLHNLVAKASNINENDPDIDIKIKKIMSMGKSNVNLTHFEIDAIIHGIKQIKRSKKKEWDKMTLVDLAYYYPTLRTIAKILYNISPKVYQLWIKGIVKRMDRENLLGQNMRNFPEYKMIESKIIDRLLKI